MSEETAGTPAPETPPTDSAEPAKQEERPNAETNVEKAVDNLLGVPSDDTSDPAPAPHQKSLLTKQEEEPVAKEGNILDDKEAKEADTTEALAKALFKDFDSLTEDKKKDAVELAMRSDATWKEWFDSGTEVEGQADRDLAVLAARHNIEPKYLSEHGIYSLKDFKERLDNEVAKSSEDAWVLADPSDEEQVKEFYDVNLGIPPDKEGYGTDWARGTLYEEDEALGKDFLEKAAESRLSRGQTAYWAQYISEAQAAIEKKRDEGRNEYIQQSREMVEKIYKDQTPEVLDSISKALHANAFGRKLLEEFGDSKFLNSPNFIGLLHDALFGHQTSWKGRGQNSRIT